MIAGVREINVYGKDIVWIDYEGCKTPEQMISVFDEAVDFLLKKNEQTLVITSLKSATITSTFMQYVEARSPLVAHLIKRNVLIGMSRTKKMSLKGFSENAYRDLQSFESEHEAIEYLIKD